MRTLSAFGMTVVLALSIGCYNKGMVGAAGGVTGGRVFKVDGLGQIEQQLMLELQSLNLDPGQVVRYGGFGDTSSLYILEYTDQESQWRIEEYKTNCSLQDVAEIGGWLRKVEALVAEAVTRQMELSAAESALERAITIAANALDRPDPPKAPADQETKESEQGEQQLDDPLAVQLLIERAKLAQQADARRSEILQHAQRRADAARKALEKVRTDLTRDRKSLLEELQKKENLLVFRWSERRKSSAKASFSEMVQLEMSDERSKSGYAVVAGIRRIRLALSRNLKSEVFGKVDPSWKLESFFEHSWSGTGIVTQVIQVKNIDYFTTADVRGKVAAVLAATPAELSGIFTPASLADLKVKLSLIAEEVAAFENQATLGKPTRWTVPFNSEMVLGKVPAYPLDGKSRDTEWMTLLAVTTTRKFLNDQGRLGTGPPDGTKAETNHQTEGATPCPSTNDSTDSNGRTTDFK